MNWSQIMIDQATIIKHLQESAHPVPIRFRKLDETIREMNATLNPLLITGQHTAKVVESDIEEPITRHTTQAVFDTDLQQWRSFKWDNFISFRI